jgi:hypothetical protein
MVFNILEATSQSSINQLIQSYINYWASRVPPYTMVSLYNLWYYTNTVNNNIVSCRAYYQFTPPESDINYWNAYFNYDTTTGLYQYLGASGNSATSTYNGLTSSDLAQLTLYYPIPNSNICFPAGTPILTDRGKIPIEKINPDIHTINNKKILGITQTITKDKSLICFEKDSFMRNIPSQKTIMSENHCIYYRDRMVKAEEFIGKIENVKKIKYTGEILYNVLMEDHDKIMVNNLICETLHPANFVAKLYKHLQKLNPQEKIEFIKKYNEYYNRNYTPKKINFSLLNK